MKSITVTGCARCPACGTEISLTTDYPSLADLKAEGFIDPCYHCGVAGAWAELSYEEWRALHPA